MLKSVLRITLTAMMFIAPMAFAHEGHVHAGSALLSGILHPFTGIDHLLAMSAIGLWSFRQNRLLSKGIPVLAVMAMLAGALLALTGMGLPHMELSIALTVLLAGLLVAALVRLPTAVGGALVVGFLGFHGFAHGAELLAGASLSQAVLYAVGFLTASFLIVRTSQSLGQLLAQRDSRILRGLGVAIAAVGGTFAFG